MDLKDRILAFIQSPDHDRFEDLAVRVFAYQFERNLPYRRYCEQLGRGPDRVGRWNDIPPVPTAAFKEMDLFCGTSSSSIAAVFLTSGTTRGPEKRGRHLVPDLALYHAAATARFRASLMPDLDRIQMLLLAPPPALAPHSSLVHMLDLVRSRFGTSNSRYAVDEQGVDLSGLVDDLKRLDGQDHPVMLIGLSYAFAQFLTVCEEQDLRFRLPPGSRIMDTGGFKGRPRELPQAVLYDLLEKRLGIAQEWIVNEYGMTEMCSQFYDGVLADRIAGRDSSRTRYKVPPHWVRTVVLDPETLAELPHGRVGLLRHFDLANLGSIMALQTEDLGYAVSAGFELAGRARGAEARGCGLLMDDLLAAQVPQP
jgi:hypothetical protein